MSEVEICRSNNKKTSLISKVLNSFYVFWRCGFNPNISTSGGNILSGRILVFPGKINRYDRKRIIGKYNQGDYLALQYRKKIFFMQACGKKIYRLERENQIS